MRHVWWHPAVIPALEKLRQESPEFEASLGYVGDPQKASKQKSAYLINTGLSNALEKMIKNFRPCNFSGTLSWKPFLFWEMCSLLLFYVNKLSHFSHKKRKREKKKKQSLHTHTCSWLSLSYGIKYRFLPLALKVSAIWSHPLYQPNHQDHPTRDVPFLSSILHILASVHSFLKTLLHITSVGLSLNSVHPPLLRPPLPKVHILCSTQQWHSVNKNLSRTYQNPYS
jgi:hypothetical protein